MRRFKKIFLLLTVCLLLSISFASAETFTFNSDVDKVIVRGELEAERVSLNTDASGSISTFITGSADDSYIAIGKLSDYVMIGSSGTPYLKSSTNVLDINPRIRIGKGHIVTGNPNGALVLNAGPDGTGENVEGIWFRKDNVLGNFTGASGYTNLMRITGDGNVGIGTTTPNAKFDVEVLGGPAAEIGGSTNQATGQYAIAMGLNTKAFGDISTAIGLGTNALGGQSFAINVFTNASGVASFAQGVRTLASGHAASSFGTDSVSSGDSSFVSGISVSVTGDNSVAFGDSINVTGDNSFGIGLSGDGYVINESNVFSVMGGNVGIGTITPDVKLNVDGNIKVTSGNDICIEGGNCLSGLDDTLKSLDELDGNIKVTSGNDICIEGGNCLSDLDDSSKDSNTIDLSYYLAESSSYCTGKFSNVLDAGEGDGWDCNNGRMTSQFMDGCVLVPKKPKQRYLCYSTESPISMLLMKRTDTCPADWEAINSGEVLTWDCSGGVSKFSGCSLAANAAGDYYQRLCVSTKRPPAYLIIHNDINCPGGYESHGVASPKFWDCNSGAAGQHGCYLSQNGGVGYDKWRKLCISK